MRQSGVTILVAAAVVASSITMSAQKTSEVHPGRAGSPHVKSEWTIDGATISIQYGRPYLKGRPDATMMPDGQPWRIGADEATVLTTDKPIKFGTLALAPGSYTLNAQPGAKEWTLMVGKPSKPDQWGVPYEAALEIGRAPMTSGKTTAPVEQVTISIDDTPAGATLRVEWGTTRATVPFTVG